MKFTILTSSNFRPTTWSGGTTTELFIFPLAAVYQQRNFQFRLSTATVEADKSDFTTLPGVSRKLMVIAGKITLIHKDHYSIQMKKFDVAEFEGAWNTTSLGQCTDFNMMTTGKVTGELSPVVIEKGQHINCNINENSDWVFVYAYSGKAVIGLNKTATISEGDLLILDTPTTGNLKIEGIENSELVIAEITL